MAGHGWKFKGRNEDDTGACHMVVEESNAEGCQELEGEEVK
jgi:hypothetical protein